VRYGIRFSCVDDAARVGTHAFVVFAVGVRLAAASITSRVVVRWNLVARVQGRRHGIHVTFKGIVLGAPVVVHVVGVAHPIAHFTLVRHLLASRIGLVPWQLGKISSGVAPATHLAHINVILPLIAQ